MFGAQYGGWFRSLRTVCLVAHQRTAWAMPRERYRLPKELPPRLLKLVRKLEAVEGNQELSPGLSTLFSKLDALEGNQLLRACRKHLHG
jgi:hypothetical protein